MYYACLECGYDGYDWDYESGGGMGAGQLWVNQVQRTIFVEELSYWFGRGAMDPNRDRGDRPMPEKRMLFLIDGEVGVRTGMDSDWLSYYVDYFVLQAYGGMADWRMEGVFSDMDKWIQEGKVTPDEIVRRTIATENFESYASTGGGFLSTMANYIYRGTYTINGETVNIDQQIGGCGLYRCGFDYNQGKGDYDGSPEYYFLRRGITTLYSIYYDRLKGVNEDK